ALTDAQRAETEELLARTETFLGRFRFVVEPEDAELTIDLRVPEPEPDGTVLLDVGEHVVAAQAEGHLPTDRRIVVAGGEEETITLALEPEAPPADGTPPPPPPEGLDRLSRGLLIGGASFAVAGLGAFGWWIERRKEAARCADASGDGGTCLNGATLDAQARGAGATTWLLLAAGATGIVAAFLREPTAETPATEAACGAWEGGAACALRHRF
ncbi:MAG TPA: hypothetical protein RMH80_31045, partial [Polyangiaceae bacterium LLY-WYZ-15_(1-7)]|nr:hypothetical protein [Polyangiaceae bacterium LLY-WYZ-15_(1-7)]